MKSKTKVALALVAAFGLGGAVVEGLHAQAKAKPAVYAVTVDHSVFDKILSENVRFDCVDYSHIKATSVQDLNNYLDLLAIVDVNKLSRNEQLCRPAALGGALGRPQSAR